MTVRLLKPYAGRPANAVTSVLDASTEAGLIAAGQATADLTGGVRYYAPKPGFNLQAPQIAVGAVSLKTEEQCVCSLPEGQVLKIVGGAGAVGEATRAGTTDKWTIGAGTVTIGPYSGMQRIPITCTAGSIDATVGDAVVTAPQLSPIAAGLQNAFGGLIAFRTFISSVITVGDSRDQLMNTQKANGNKSSQHWFNWMNGMLDQSLRVVANFGNASKRTDEYLDAATVYAIAAMQADMVIFDLGIINNLTQSSSTPFIDADGNSVTDSNVALVAYNKVIWAANIFLKSGKFCIFLSEIGGNSNLIGMTAQHIKQMFEYNQRIFDFSRTTPGCRFIDITDVCWVSSAAGTIQFAAGDLNDNTHHSSKLAYKIAKKVLPEFQAIGVRPVARFPKSLSNINANNPLSLFDNTMFATASGGSTPTANTITVTGVGGSTGTAAQIAVLNTPKNCQWIGAATATANLVSITPNSYGGNDLTYDVANTAAGLVELVFDTPAPSKSVFTDVIQGGMNVAVAAGSSNIAVEWQTHINATINGVQTTFNGYDLYSGVGGPGPTEAYSHTLASQPSGFPIGTTAANKGYTQGRLGFRTFAGGGSMRITISMPHHQRMFAA